MICRLCPKIGIENGLIAFFNTDDSDSWLNFSNNFIVKSLKSWECHTVGQFQLKDYGLTMFDVGRSNEMFSDTRVILSDDIYPKLYPVHYNDISGNTLLDTYVMSGATYEWRKRDISGSTNIICLEGGYLQNYFKLEGYDFEQLPYRYKDGYTFNTRLLIENDNFLENYSGNTGFFLFLGTRAENKYSIDICEEKFIKTNENALDLGSDHSDNLQFGVNGNVIGFYINKHGNIGVRYIDDNGNLFDTTSCNTLNSGWYNIDIVFSPYVNLNKNELSCVKRRNGLLRIFVNGLLFWEKENFPEIWLTPMDSEPEKQIGVPYNLSWGGGSFGLKHSLRFLESENLKFNELLLSGATKDNFTTNNSFIGNPTNPYSTIRKTTSGDTLFSTVELPIKSDHHYNVTVTIRLRNLYDQSVFNRIISTFDIELNKTSFTNISGVCDNTPLLNTEYINLTNTYISGTTENYVTFSKFIRTEKNCLEVRDKFNIIFNEEFSYNGIFDIIDFKVEEFFYDYDCIGNEFCSSGQTTINEDCNNNISIDFSISGECSNIYQKKCELQDLNIEKYFDGSFIGCLHKLRIYERPLSLEEIRANYEMDKSEIGGECKTNRIIKDGFHN